MDGAEPMTMGNTRGNGPIAGTYCAVSPIATYNTYSEPHKCQAYKRFLIIGGRYR